MNPFIKESASKKLRIWRLGNLEYNIFPTQAGVDKLATMLEGWDGKSDLEIIWGPDLTVEQVDMESNAIDLIVPIDAEVKWNFDRQPLNVEVTATPKVRLIKHA